MCRSPSLWVCTCSRYKIVFLKILRKKGQCHKKRMPCCHRGCCFRPKQRSANLFIFICSHFCHLGGFQKRGSSLSSFTQVNWWSSHELTNITLNSYTGSVFMPRFGLFLVQCLNGLFLICVTCMPNIYTV